MGKSVLASADGCAYYRYSGGEVGREAGGNEIHIIHSGVGNGYQTRYFHLQPDGLITREINPERCVNVVRGQQIGRVGSTGKSSGAHIHFMVVPR